MTSKYPIEVNSTNKNVIPPDIKTQTRATQTDATIAQARVQKPHKISVVENPLGQFFDQHRTTKEDQNQRIDKNLEQNIDEQQVICYLERFIQLIKDRESIYVSIKRLNKIIDILPQEETKDLENLRKAIQQTDYNLWKITGELNQLSFLEKVPLTISNGENDKVDEYSQSLESHLSKVDVRIKETKISSNLKIDSQTEEFEKRKSDLQREFKDPEQLKDFSFQEFKRIRSLFQNQFDFYQFVKPKEIDTPNSSLYWEAQRKFTTEHTRQYILYYLENPTIGEPSFTFESLFKWIQIMFEQTESSEKEKELNMLRRKTETIRSSVEKQVPESRNLTDLVRKQIDDLEQQKETIRVEKQKKMELVKFTQPSSNVSETKRQMCYL